MKPTLEEVGKAVNALTNLVPFFPSDTHSRLIITAEIRSFVGTVEQLSWFLQACVRHISKWQGVPQLRALYCTRFEPADGVAPVVDTPGFTTPELEAKYLAREIEENERQLEAYRREALLAPPEDREPFLLPEAKTLGPAPTEIVPHKFVRQRGKSLKELEEELKNAPKGPVRSDAERALLASQVEERARAERGAAGPLPERLM
jgi:hypothetical protein